MDRHDKGCSLEDDERCTKLKHKEELQDDKKKQARGRTLVPSSPADPLTLCLSVCPVACPFVVRPMRSEGVVRI